MWRWLIILFAFTLPVVGVATPNLVLTSGDYRPFISDQLAHQGVLAHIVKEAGKRQGMEIEIKFVLWQQAKIEAQIGKAHGTVGWGYTPERERDFIYSAPIYTESVVFFHLKNRYFDWQSLESLNGLNVGISEDYIEDNMLETFNQEGGSVIIHKYPNELEKVKSLLTGQSDVIIGNQYVIHDVVRNQLRNDESRHITFNPKPLRVTPLHVLFSRQHPQSALWVSQFNRGLRQLKMSGDYQRAWSAFRMGEYGLIGIPAEQP